ncbi:putative membrane protein [Vogesella indigofera]|uniref:Protoporphyrinogen IX oxidase n=1 Tax=Vogesella indigofera TaxID=45465 RepID=A0A495BHG1_VOGIN|nr:CopD family protein [Vogesella indigofera]RKQ60248.1 putative membrane protein [Vogesella indigofera]
MTYLYIKAFHLFFVVSWFAGLFYLPRLYVNLALAEPGKEYDRLLLMAFKLFRFMTPLAVLALALGLLLWLGYGVGGGWLHAKLALVTVLVGYHGYCYKLLQDFVQQRNRRSHVWFRFFNELPVLLLLAVLILVVVKPF